MVLKYNTILIVDLYAGDLIKLPNYKFFLIYKH